MKSKILLKIPESVFLTNNETTLNLGLTISSHCNNIFEGINNALRISDTVRIIIRGFVPPAYLSYSRLRDENDCER
jgi:hypothetical protein